MKRWEEAGWDKEDLDKLELSFLTEAFKLKDKESVDVIITYSKLLNKIGAHPDNYPIYLKLIEVKNHWVVDALLGKNDPKLFFDHIQPNYYIIRECFKSFTRAKRGGIYSKSLLVFYGLLEKTYKNPLEGYRVYPCTPTDVNNLGKHLDEKKDQLDPVNAGILYILDRIAALVAPGRPEENKDIVEVATQANNIRGKFLDKTKSLKEAIPDELLKTENYQDGEIPPSSAKTT